MRQLFAAKASLNEAESRGLPANSTGGGVWTVHLMRGP